MEWLKSMVYCFLSCSFLKQACIWLSEIDCSLWSLEISTYKMCIAIYSFPALCASGLLEDMVCKRRDESLLTSCLWIDLRPHSCFILLDLLPYKHIWFLSFALCFSFGPGTEKQHNHLLKNAIHVEPGCFALQMWCSKAIDNCGWNCNNEGSFWVECDGFVREKLWI